MENLIKNLDDMIKDSKENVSILITELNNPKYIYRYNDKIKMISASTIKVPIMLAVLEEVKNGSINLDDKILVHKSDILSDTEIFENGENYYSLYELINWMIIDSDNTATNVIIKKFGMNKINDYISKVLNLKLTVLERYMLDKQAMENGLNNYTSQEDMLNIFATLFNKDILNYELCDKAIEILYNQRCQDQVMRYIYQPVKYAHKTGSLDYLNHDVGVMKINNKYFYIGISVYNSKNKKGNKRLIGNLGKTIYEYLKENN
jgi:beta-lactamase class A